MNLRRHSRGDTIVEVLISMAVASSVMGGAYVVVNRTLANSQQAQEHSEALKIAEGQLEQLKKYAENNADAIASSPSRAHCFDASGNLVDLPASVSSLPASDTAYPAACELAGAQGYKVAFLYNDRGTAADTLDDIYTIHVNWPGPTGGQDEVKLSYRVYR